MTNDFTNLPVVNIGALVSHGASEEQKRLAISAIDDAFRHVGFMYITHHGIDLELFDRVRSLTRKFFMQDSSVKDMIAISNQKVPVRGYQKIGENITQGSPDWHEGIDMYRELPETHPLKLTDDPMHSSNQWPITPSEFKPVMELYIEKMLALGATIMEGVAIAFNLPRDYFQRFYNESYWVMRTLYYPTKESITHCSKPEDFGCGEHTDYGCLTLINCDEIGGALQVKNRQNQWIDADPVKGAFIVNVGDMLSHWTNGVYRSTSHRVNSVHGSDRVSIPFFFEPNYDAEIVPFNSKSDELPIIFGKHLSKRVLSNFKYSPNVETDNLSRGI